MNLDNTAVTDVDDDLGPVTDAAVNRIATFARRQLELEDEISRLEKELSLKHAELARVSQVDLPAAMDTAEIADFTLTGGFKITVGTKITARPLKDDVPIVVDYLDEQGHSAIVKHDVTVSFGMKDDEAARAFIEWVMSVYPKNKLNDKTYVHPQTLDAYVREQLARGVILPEEFGVVALRSAKITRPDTTGDAL